MNIESQLTELLQRREPPPGFAERVMARVEDRDSRPSGPPGASVLHLHSHRRRALAAAAAIVILAGAWGVRVTLHARDELRLALRITAEKVVDARQQVRAVAR